jgi:hypothetical protein
MIEVASLLTAKVLVGKSRGSDRYSRLPVDRR